MCCVFDVPAHRLSASDTIDLLLQTGLIDTALCVCLMFSLSLTRVFTALTDKCLQLQLNRDPSSVRCVVCSYAYVVSYVFTCLPSLLLLLLTLLTTMCTGVLVACN